MTVPAMLATAGAETVPTAGWLRPLRHWPRELLEQLQHHDTVVRVLVARVQGSAPRDAGTCMLVTPTTVHGTIGGGNLELQAIASARQQAQAGIGVTLERQVLASDLAQCCGGVVELWTECWRRHDTALLRRIAEAFDRNVPSVLISESGAEGGVVRTLRVASAASALPSPLRLVRSQGSASLEERLGDAAPALWLFGAGHVGQALARLMAELPFHCTWIDDRPGVFPAELPPALRVCEQPPLEAAESAPAGARFIVMTHDHALDYRLVRTLLSRGDARFVGMIGSDSKAARFRSRLARDGLDAARIAGLTCPIGIAGIRSKWPAAIAVSVAAQLLQTLEAPAARRPFPIVNTALDCSRAPCPACRTPDA